MLEWSDSYVFVCVLVQQISETTCGSRALSPESDHWSLGVPGLRLRDDRELDGKTASLLLVLLVAVVFLQSRRFLVRSAMDLLVFAGAVACFASGILAYKVVYTYIYVCVYRKKERD